MQEKASQNGRLSQFIDKFCFLLYNNSALMGGRDDTIHGRRFGYTLVKGVDANANHITYWTLYGHNYCKETRKPPLGKVTVSEVY